MEPLWLVNGGAEGQRGDRANAGYAHQAATDRLATHDGEDPLGEMRHLTGHGGDDREQRLTKLLEHGIGTDKLADPSGKRFPAGCAELQSGFAQHRPDTVLNV